MCWQCNQSCPVKDEECFHQKMLCWGQRRPGPTIDRPLPSCKCPRERIVSFHGGGVLSAIDLLSFAYQKKYEECIFCPHTISRTHRIQRLCCQARLKKARATCLRPLRPPVGNSHWLAQKEMMASEFAQNQAIPARCPPVVTHVLVRCFAHKGLM